MPVNARNTVKFKLDVVKTKPLSAAQRIRMAAVAAMPDSAIDYSDIPKQRGKVKWSRPGALVPSENKRQVTLRVDSDVLNFFRAASKRYQSRINTALREYMKAYHPPT